MSKNIDIDELLVLLLIDRRPSFRSSYVLIKVLSRMFDILDYRKAADFLVENNFLKREIIDQVSHYTITLSGEELLSRHEKELHMQLLALYPNEKEFIDNLWAIKM